MSIDINQLPIQDKSKNQKVLVEQDGIAQRVPAIQFLGELVTLYEGSSKKNTTITLSEKKENFKFLIFYHDSAYGCATTWSMNAIRQLKQNNPLTNGGGNNADRTFMLSSYDTHYTDILIDDVNDNKIRIDNTGSNNGIWRIEGIR